MTLTPEARQQVRRLLEYYEEHERPEANRALRTALVAAWDKLTTTPDAGLPAPRPYPQLAQPGRFGLKSGRYWIAYRAKPAPLIVAVFFETANIHGRL